MTTIRHMLTHMTRAFAPRAENFGNYFKLGCAYKTVCFYLLAVTLTACLATLPTTASARDAVRRDVEGYAIASCLVHQKQPYLKDQGDAWASAIIQRGEGSIKTLLAVDAAVKKAIAKGHMTFILSDEGPRHTIALPVAYCFEIIDSPPVRIAIEKAIKELAPAYKK